MPLLEEGAPVAETNEDGDTALMLASRESHAEVAQPLLDKDAYNYASGAVSDAPTGVDRLGCTIYAKAVAATAFESLCVGIYAGCGGGKTFLWMLIQRVLLALALVETLEKLHEQANKLTRLEDARAREKAVGAFEKAVDQLRDPEAKWSAMVDEEDKQRFKNQLDTLQRAMEEPVDSASCGDADGRLGQVMDSLVSFLIDAPI